MELKIDDIIRVVNDNHRRALEQAKISEQREKEVQELIAKKQKVENVKKGAIMIGMGVILGLAPTAKVIADGYNEIICEFDDATSEYGIRDYSDDYQINYGTNYIGFEDGINGMIDAAREEGMNDVEIAIGLNSIISNTTTEKFIDTSLKDRCNMCVHRAIEKELSGEYKNGK